MDNIQLWEVSLIGTLIGDQKLFQIVSDIKPEDMSSPQHEVIWRHAVELAKRGGLGAQALSNSLKEAGVLDSIGNGTENGDAYIFYMMAMGDPSTIDEFADHVRDKAANRKLIEVTALAMTKARNDNDPAQIVDWLAQNIIAIRREKEQPVLLADLSDPYNEQQQQIMRGEQVPFLEVPLPELQDVVPKFNNNDFILVVGQPGTGKSSFLRWLTIQIALKKPEKGVLVLPFENSEAEFHSWAVSMLSGVNHLKVEDWRKCSQTEIEMIGEAEQQLDAMKYYIQSMGMATINDVARRARKMAMVHDLSMVAVDGAYLISGNEKDGEYATISRNMQVLRNLAQELDVPVLATTQFSRKVVTRKTPELGDILYSGENAARIVMAIVKEEVDVSELMKIKTNVTKTGAPRILHGGELTSIPIHIKVMKNTGGSIGKTPPFLWHKHINAYERWERVQLNVENEDPQWVQEDHETEAEKAKKFATAAAMSKPVVGFPKEKTAGYKGDRGKNKIFGRNNRQ